MKKSAARKKTSAGLKPSAPKNRTKRTRAASRPKLRVAVRSDVRIEQAAQDRFVNDLDVRGEVAELGEGGTLPLEATHVRSNAPGDARKVQRVRFKTV